MVMRPKQLLMHGELGVVLGQSCQLFLFISIPEQCFRTVNLSGNVHVGKK